MTGSLKAARDRLPRSHSPAAFDARVIHREELTRTPGRWRRGGARMISINMPADLGVSTDAGTFAFAPRPNPPFPFFSSFLRNATRNRPLPPARARAFSDFICNAKLREVANRRGGSAFRRVDASLSNASEIEKCSRARARACPFPVASASSGGRGGGSGQLRRSRSRFNDTREAP